MAMLAGRVAGVLAVLCTLMLPGGPAAASPGPPAVVYTVVGQQDSLFSIAAETLGDGLRYPEIVDLNRARIQPDGRRMTDAAVEPGWVIVLPADARGPRVRVGPLPAFPVGGITAGPTRTPPPPVAAPSVLWLRVGATVLAVALLTIGLWVLRAGRS